MAFRLGSLPQIIAARQRIHWAQYWGFDTTYALKNYLVDAKFECYREWRAIQRRVGGRPFDNGLLPSP